MFTLIMNFVFQSHPIQVGSNMERVMFNPKGQSPLIVHFLRMKQLKECPAKSNQSQESYTERKAGTSAIAENCLVPVNKVTTMKKVRDNKNESAKDIYTPVNEFPGMA